MQSKQQRLYYEQNNKEKVRQELEEMVKQEKETDKCNLYRSYNPHDSSYYT